MTRCPFTGAACGGDSPLPIYDGVVVDLSSSTTSLPSLIPPQDTAPAASLLYQGGLFLFSQILRKSFMWRFHEHHIFTHPDRHLRLFSCAGEGVVQCTQCSIWVAPVGREARKSHPCTTADLMLSCMSSHGHRNK